MNILSYDSVFGSKGVTAAPVTKPLVIPPATKDNLPDHTVHDAINSGGSVGGFVPYSPEVSGPVIVPHTQRDETPIPSAMHDDPIIADSQPASFWDEIWSWLGISPSHSDDQPVSPSNVVHPSGIETSAPDIQPNQPTVHQYYDPSVDAWGCSPVQGYGFWGALLSAALTTGISVGGSIAVAEISKKKPTTVTQTPAVNTTTTYIVSSDKPATPSGAQNAAQVGNSLVSGVSDNVLIAGVGVAALLLILTTKKK